nr:hypothetical protein [Alteribacter keqinensis]
MADCCSSEVGTEFLRCPSCGNKGKKVKIITVKAMLKPASLGTLNAGSAHLFCPAKDCQAVYFDEIEKTYGKTDVKVPVYQKEASSDTPVC